MDERIEVSSVYSQRLVRFLLTIVEEYLGPVPGRVMRILIKSGPLPINQIAKQSDLNASQVKTPLKILMQHGMVTSSKPSKGPRLFAHVPSEISARIRVPKYVAMVGERVGIEAEVVVELLGEHGRLSIGQILSLFRTSESAPTAQAEVRLRECIQSLIVERFLEPIDHEGDLDALTEQQPPRKRVRTETSGGIHGADDQVYRLNHDTFNFHFRNDLIVEFVNGRIDSTAGAIVRAMMTHQGKASSAPIDVPNPNLATRNQFSEMAMFDVLPESPSVSRSQLRQYLHEMLNDNVPILILSESIDSGEEYSVNIDAILIEIRRRHAFSIVKTKYGDEAARIFSLLIEKKRLEEKSISDFALVSRKHAREKLYRMMEGGFVSLQEVPKSADRNPQKTIYIWSVPMNQVKANIRQSLLFAWANLRNRYQSEMETAQPVLQRLKDADNKLDTLPDHDIKGYQIWQKKSERLENAMLKIDDDILLFHDL